MDVSQLVQMVGDYGYGALFFALWLGIVGMPVPDEVIVMTGGLVTSLGILQPWAALLVTWLGVISGLSLGFVLGRTVGPPMLRRLAQKEKFRHYLDVSQRLIDRHGAAALVISYFFPVVRHVVPYIVGVGRMPWWRFALVSYTAGGIWTALYFLLGRWFGGAIALIGETVHVYGLYALGVFVLAGIGWYLWYTKGGGMTPAWKKKQS
jgi:membrane-associated protein